MKGFEGPQLIQEVDDLAYLSIDFGDQRELRGARFRYFQDEQCGHRPFAFEARRLCVSGRGYGRGSADDGSFYPRRQPSPGEY